MGKKIIHTIIIFLLCINGFKSQTWCPTGAEWTYSYSYVYPQANGYVVLKYMGDTLLNSMIYKKLNGTFYGTNAAYGSGTVTLQHEKYYIRQNNKLVHVYNGFTPDDTLFNFNAVPGDKWLRARISGTVCNVTRRAVTVIDTGSVVINGITLKKLVLSYVRGLFVGSGTTSYTDTVYEKIGSIKFHLIPWTCETATAMPDASGSFPAGNFRCYKDDFFATYHKTGMPGCYSPVAINELNESGSISVFPNPNSGIFKVVLTENSKNATAQVLDYSGRKIYEGTLLEGENKFELKNISAGIYLLIIATDGQSTVPVKLIIR